MRRYYNQAKSLLFSATAKDTFILFVGNIGSAFWGFFFTLFAARSMSVYDFGILSAVLNLVVILASIADIGISSGSINFVSVHTANKEEEKANEYTKAAFLIRLFIVIGISIVVAVFAPFVSKTFLASNDPKVAIWAAVIPLFLFPDMFFPHILRAKRKFFHSTLVDNVFYFTRLVFALAFFVVGGLTMDKAFWAFGAGFIVELILIMFFVKVDYLYSKPNKLVYTNLLKYSGWLGVNSIVSSVAGRLDIQMLASMAGATSTGLYSIPSRLASFITVFSGSFSSVLAPRLAGFGDKEAERKYILKSTLAVLPIILGIIIWVLVAKPFIFILFGEKYVESVPIFQALALAQIPVILTIPSVTAIIYSMKKTIFVGLFSFFQLVAIFIINLIFIPKYGVFGPTITYGIINLIFAIYTWIIVIKHYWVNQEK